jgi:hypothetical protein
MDAFARQLYAIQEVARGRFQFQGGPGTHGSAGVYDARHKPGVEGEAELRAAGKSFPHGMPTTQAASINADLLDFLNAGT